MNGDFTGKAIIITGASSGLGRSMALTLGRAGADLWLVGRNGDELTATAHMVVEAGGAPAACVAMDLRERGPLSALVADVATQHGHLFALINNAGVMYPEPIVEGDMDRWQAMFDINVMASLEGAQAAIRAMRAHGLPGHVINISSVQTRFEEPGVYGATKKAVEMIGASLRAEVERDDIGICTIIPGGFATRLARDFQPETMARLVENFTRMGIAPDGPDAHQILGDPSHVADMVRHVLSLPIEINIQEVVIRPPVGAKAS